tara:strand:+ start:21 stop:1115 length:1095 start_codon:yes stop_codon:yes gene_type:complete
MSEEDPEWLLQRAEELDRGPEQVGLIEEAIRLADLRQDEDLGFEARVQLIEAGTFAGYPEQVMVAFSWCLARCDKDSERFDERGLLWQYKWVALHLPNFPQVPRAKIEGVFQDMEERYRRAGRNLRPIHKLRWIMHRDMGEREAALAAWRAGRRLQRDYGADCAACERNDEVRYFLYVDKVKQALATALPLLSGLESCATVPESTFGMVLIPLLKLNKTAEADRWHRQGVERVRRKLTYVGSIGDHLSYAVIRGDLELARELVEETLGLALKATDKRESFGFLCSALIWAEAELAAGSGPLELTLPAEVAGKGTQGYAPSELEPWLAGELDALAGRFDERNGNSHLRQEVARRRQEARELAQRG